MNSSNMESEVLAALQDFKTCFELAKASAGNLCKKSEPSKDDQSADTDLKKTPPPTLEVPEVVENFLEQVSKTGVIGHPWKVVKPLFLYKLDAVMRWYNRKQSFDALPSMPNSTDVTFNQLHATILRAADTFKQAPFTVQRLCELICYPERHYKRIDKYLNALEKNTMIVTTVNEQGRKLSTAAETDLSLPDTQQTERLLALFDWIHTFNSPANGTASPVSPNKEPTSTCKHLDVVSTDESATDSKDETKAECSISSNSTSSTSPTSSGAAGYKCVKRLLSEDNETPGDLVDQIAKRARLETEDSQQVDSTINSIVDEGAQSTSNSHSQDSAMACQHTDGVDNASQDSDTLTDPFAEDLPLDSDQMNTSPTVAESAEPTTSQLTTDTETKAADVTSPATASDEPQLDVCSTEAAVAPESTAPQADGEASTTDSTSSKDSNADE